MALAHYQGYVENVSTGKALEGAVIRVYSYPGNILQSTFADPSSTPKPVVSSDANGAFNFYIPDGFYDLEYVYNGDVLTRLVNIPIYNPANALPAADLGAFGEVLVANATAADARADLGVNSAAEIAASGGSALVGFLQAGTGAVARTMENKARETQVHLNDYREASEGVNADTNALNRAIAYLQSINGGTVHLPRVVSLTSTINIPCDGITIKGEGRYSGGAGGTVVSFTPTSGPVFKSSNQTTATRLFCGFHDLIILATGLTSAKVCLDLKSFQFSVIENVWVFGSGAGCVGVNLEANYGVTECTYNRIVNIYIGNVETGVRIYDGANMNIICGGRIQNNIAGGYAVLLSASSLNYVNANVIDSLGIEFGLSVYGIQVGANVVGTSIQSCRFEQLGIAIYIAPTSTKTTLTGNYYDSCSNDVLRDAGANLVVSVENGGVKFANENIVDSKTLDWYEEGSFTPIVVGSTTNGVGTYTLQSGSFTRIGRQVFFAGQVATSAHTGTGNMQISGLPFAIKNEIHNAPFSVLCENLTFAGQLGLLGLTNTNKAGLYVQATGAALSALAIDAAATLYFSGTYHV